MSWWYSHVPNTPRAMYAPVPDWVDPELQEGGLTHRKREHILKKEIRNPAVAELFQRAKWRLRGVLTWMSIRQDLTDYGTSSKLLGANQVYKSNLGTILRGKFKYMRRGSTQHHTPKWIFLPEDKFKQFWNVFLLFLLIYVCIGTPWIIAFETVTIGSELYYLELAVDICFFADILITLNSAYYAEEVLVCDRKRIFLNYLTGLLLVDIIAIFPFYIFEDSESGNKSNSLIRIIRITRLVRVFRASKLLKVVRHLTSDDQAEQFKQFLNDHAGVARLVAAGFFILIMAHFTACMWYFVARLDNFGPDTWVTRNGWIDKDNGFMYLSSVYWALTILTTVGFGDIHAGTEGEMILCIIWEVLGIGCYTFLIGSLTSILTSMDKKKAVLHQNIADIEKFALENNLPRDVLKVMKKEVMQAQVLEVMDQNQRIATLKLLSKDLQASICMKINDRAAEKVEFLRKQDITFITEVVPRLTYVWRPPHKFMYRKGDHPDGIYFLAEGRVNYVIGPDDVAFKTIINGSYFGEIELLFRGQRRFSVVSESRVLYLFMTAALFKEVMDSYSRVANEITQQAYEKKLRDQEAMDEVIDVLDSLIIKKERQVSDLAGARPPRRRTTLQVPVERRRRSSPTHNIANTVFGQVASQVAAQSQVSSASNSSVHRGSHKKGLESLHQQLTDMGKYLDDLIRDKTEQA